MTRILILAATLSLLLSSPALANFAAGKTAYDTKNWEQAILSLRPLAESGDARAAAVCCIRFHTRYDHQRDVQIASGRTVKQIRRHT